MKKFERMLVLLVAVAALAACGSAPVHSDPGPGGDVVIVDGEQDAYRGDRERGPGFIPPGHYPPPGECRVWFAGRPPGQQPPPEPCDRLYGTLPYGSFLLYNEKAWDTKYDWRTYERRNPRSVPGLVLELMADLAREDR